MVFFGSAGMIVYQHGTTLSGSCFILCLSKAASGKKQLATKVLNVMDHQHGVWLSIKQLKYSINGVVLPNYCNVVI